MAGPEDLTALHERVAALEAELAAHERRARSVHDDLVAKVEQLESHSTWLQRMLEWYSDLHEFAPTAQLSLDAGGLICDINLTGAALLQVERQRLIGRPLRLHIVYADRRLFLEHMRRCRGERGQVVSELRLQRSDGSELPIQLLSKEDNTAIGLGPTYRSVIFDLSERKQTEEVLRLGHQRLSLALAASEAGLHEYSWPGGALQSSPRWAEILGCDPDVPATADLWAWLEARIDPADLAARQRAHAAFIAGQSTGFHAEFRVQRGDGNWIWVRELAQAAERDAQGRGTRVVGVLLDVSAEHERLAEAQRRSELLSRLSAELFRVEENERRELAALLHDDLGQRLVAVRFKVAAALPHCDEGAITGLNQAMVILDVAQHNVRSMSFQLSPPILHDLGLVPALHWLAGELASSYGLQVEIDDEGPLPALHGDPSFLLFRCIRELLFNVVKHASVQKASVRLRSHEHYLHIEVEDDGHGFSPERLATRRLESRSFGLLSVQERVEGLGGHLVIDSAPGRGTRVLMRIPLAVATSSST
ncbi:MAG: PAS domain S-box protein [Nannocystis sp.]|nr:PAS domain-containing sensor histidine kinase [Nannocystis sp.]MBA3548645.1 PAS domain S-box protein [Nannocystis sp.]